MLFPAADPDAVAVPSLVLPVIVAARGRLPTGIDAEVAAPVARPDGSLTAPMTAPVVVALELGFFSTAGLDTERVPALVAGRTGFGVVFAFAFDAAAAFAALSADVRVCPGATATSPLGWEVVVRETERLCGIAVAGLLGDA